MIKNSIQEKTHQNCFICGNANPWSLGLDFYAADDGWVYSEFQAHDKLQGYEGILHGGIVSSLLDAAMTHCLFHRNIQAVTGELLVRFLHPIACDAKLKLRACLLLEKTPLYIVKSELIYKDKVVAKAQAKFMRR
jgi:uncharacterized protein (TIGR00369 family)